MLRRNIPLNYRNVTGVAYSRSGGNKTPFESPLERDFIELLRFDTSSIASYESQTPVIFYKDELGRKRRYTPDLFVRYHSGRNVMFEVKSREFLWKHWQELKPKFKQAIRYGKEHGYHFKIVTEVEIRTDYLANIKFLSRFQSSEDYDPRYALLLDKLELLESSTPHELIGLVGESQETRAELLHIFWQLVADRLIDVDLCEPLTMTSAVWHRLGRQR